ncbi:hypothetical protein JRO89_XS14G0120600 [Xanthoceras sorbifolium]|uniref:Chlorophyll(Ide) b reductase NOL, chloroplastic n=1 Tax=Xanthoceras sorbifolium TaxID=99658 RepID=A0ABQ8H503_9ROSI|nr:hypothetical protein JRO89_XS14G0120600 [Xanthoceras sorbifolium]
MYLTSNKELCVWVELCAMANTMSSVTSSHYLFYPKSHEFRFPSFSRPKPLVFDSFTLISKPCHSGFITMRLRAASSSSSTSVKTDPLPMVPPYNVLITGSTKGIGYALAKQFLKAGDNVIICSRSGHDFFFVSERVESALNSLREDFGEQHVWGTTCDVRKGQDVKDLVAFAEQNLKYIDIWINNAGSNAYCYKPLAEASDEDLIEVVTTNTLGLMICCREAIKMMRNQPRGGHIFNIDGAGSDGRPTPRQNRRATTLTAGSGPDETPPVEGVMISDLRFDSVAPDRLLLSFLFTLQFMRSLIKYPVSCVLVRFAAYGATKRSVVHLTKSLQAELQMQEDKNVVVHNLSVIQLDVPCHEHAHFLFSLFLLLAFTFCIGLAQPGMVTTDLLMSGATTKQAKFFINVLAEPAEVVAEYLVPRIRSILTNGSTRPTYLRFLTGIKAYSQIFSRLAFGARRNRYVLED